ncbi:MAG: insulinase family protein [Chloroflexota bacterium]|nr:insulinase family protein [Chloroflexota bacterium]
MSTPVEGVTPLVSRTLDNGLTVFLREDHGAPLTSFWIWYRVGSRNEQPGRTGLSHWVEHMQFKGTPSLEKGAIFREVSRHGGTLNAMTSMDWTAYFETLPADAVDLSLKIESDRMRNSLFDAAETESERTVILNERQGAENRPTYHLAEEMIGAAFRAHPYRHMVIGHEADLRAITRDDLYNHYQRYYTPRNAFVTAVGDFQTDEMFRRIEQAFGDIPTGEPIDSLIAQEPPQRAERLVTLRRPSPAAYIMMGYRMPAASHPDIPALLVADSILSGAKPMGLGGGSAMGRSSRLYRALVATGLTRGASSGMGLHIDPYLWTFSATALPSVEPERIEETFEEQLERLRSEPASEEEFLKARKQTRAQYVYSSETVTAQAFITGQMEIVDNAGRVDTLEDELAAVTPEDVQRVARTWLKPDQRTIGWQFPEDGASAFSGVEVPVDPSMPVETMQPFDVERPWYLSDGVETGGSYGFARTTLPNGIVVLAQPRPGDPAIGGSISIEAGQNATHDMRPGIASLMADTLNRGTENRTFVEYNEAIDSLGAMLHIGAGRRSVNIDFHSLSEDLPTVLELASDVIQHPSFPEDELEKVRQQAITSLREDEDDTGSVAGDAMRELLYPEDNPSRLPLDGTIESVERFTREDLAEYHAAHVAPGVTTVTLAGGVASIEEAVAHLERAFGDWKLDTPETTPPVSVDAPKALLRDDRTIAGKSQANLVMAYPTLPRSHGDYYALNVANVILGQLGLMGRLGATVRDEQGLAYHVSSSLSPGIATSLWTARAGVDPANVDRTIEGILSEVRRLRSEPVSEAELADAKTYIVGSLPLSLESLGGVTSLLQTIQRFGHGLDYLDRFPDIIKALTVADLHRAAQEHLDPDHVVIGTAGPGTMEGTA